MSNILFSRSLVSAILKMKYLCILQRSLFIVAALATNISLADSPTTIYGYSLEFRLKQGGTEQYNELFNVLKQEGLEFDLKIRPFKRVIRTFMSEQGHMCFFPTSKNAIAKSSPEINKLPLIMSHGVDQISLRVFTRSGSPTIAGITELKGKRVALWNGLDSKLLLGGEDVIIETTPDELVRVKMLDAGRIDVILGFTPDVILAAQLLNLPEPHFDESLALFRDEGAALACMDTPQNRTFVKKFNIIIKKLKNNGQLRKILGPYVDLAH